MSMAKTVLIVLVVLAFASACARDSGDDKNYELLSSEAVACEPPAQVEVQPWGKSGLSKSCSIKSGGVVTAENGYVHLRGQYDAGKQAGIWRWYDRRGNVVKEIDYSAKQTR